MAQYDYSTTLVWLNKMAIVLGEKGYLVAIQHTTGSLRLRIEGFELIGELLVWDTMLAVEIVAQLGSGMFLFESYGRTIGLYPPEEELNAFFGYFPI